MARRKQVVEPGAGMQLPSWITIKDIKRYRALKSCIFRDGPFVIWDSLDDALMTEYNALALKMARLDELIKVTRREHENRMSYGGHARR